MFKHRAKETDVETPKTEEKDVNLASNIAKGSPDASSADEHPSATPHHRPAATEMSEVKELLEKNLKWSQIIYEQNRKINGKLFWTAFANWLRLAILVATFRAAAWFLPPLLGNVLGQYNSLMEGISDPAAAIKNNTSSQDICKLLPANLQESCKSLTNKK